MIGDKLVISNYHRQAAVLIYEQICLLLEKSEKPLAITVAGESGSGKSEIAVVLASLIDEAGFKALILQQDDYFVYPPRTNHEKRIEAISWVGLQEVKLGLIDQHLEQIKTGSDKCLVKPLVHYDRDEIIQEKLSIDNVKVAIAEGTYTTSLKNADFKAFIDRTYLQTKKARLARSREKYSPFIEQVLSIEHKIIAGHKPMADLVIPAPAEERSG
jgi:uridine kinase